jgi:hypothetical protein
MKVVPFFGSALNLARIETTFMLPDPFMADVEPGLPARRNRRDRAERPVNISPHAGRAICPGGKMPPSTAGREARRHCLNRLLTIFDLPGSTGKRAAGNPSDTSLLAACFFAQRLS